MLKCRSVGTVDKFDLKSNEQMLVWVRLPPLVRWKNGELAQLELYFIRFTFSTFYLYLYKRSKKWQIQKEQKNRIIVNNTN